MDKEKVINCLTDIENIMIARQEICPREELQYWIELQEGVADALSLLNEQEAVTIKKTKEHGFGVYGGICPKCCNWIQSAHSFCGFCGQAVKWE